MKISEAKVRKLKKIRINVTRKKGKQNLNAYTTSDEEFLKWFTYVMGGIDSTNRLEFRLTLLNLLDELRTGSGRARRREIVYV